ncbi:hypothetical protein BJ742DRAFT_864441 [Cladochytrium replicatum]|nr:hypothetical protein BJ742DRAFT_864441 [Cladochytrium replicatum]
MTRRNDNSYRPSRRQSPRGRRECSVQEIKADSPPSSQSTSITVRLNPDGRDVSLRQPTLQNPQTSTPNNSSEPSIGRQSHPGPSSQTNKHHGSEFNSSESKQKPTVFSRLGKRNDVGNETQSNERHIPAAREARKPDHDGVDRAPSSNSGSSEKAGSKRERSSDRSKPRASTKPDRSDNRSRELNNVHSRRVEPHSSRDPVENNLSTRSFSPSTRSTQLNGPRTTDDVHPSRSQKLDDRNSTNSRGRDQNNLVQLRDNSRERPQERRVDQKQSTEKPNRIIEAPGRSNEMANHNTPAQMALSPPARSTSESAVPPSMSESRFADSRESGDVISLNGDDDVLDWDDDESMMDGASGSTYDRPADNERGHSRKNSMDRPPPRRRDSARSAAGSRPRGEDRPKASDIGKALAENRSQRKRSRSPEVSGDRQPSQNQKRSRSADGLSDRRDGRSENNSRVDDRTQGQKGADRAGPVSLQGRSRPAPAYGPPRQRDHSDGTEGRNADRDTSRNGYPSGAPVSHMRARAPDGTPIPPLPYSWTQTSRNGRVYFYNTETRESVWELPAHVQIVMDREYAPMRELRRGAVDAPMDRGPRKGDRDAWGRGYQGAPEPPGHFPPPNSGRPLYRQGEEMAGRPTEIPAPERLERDWPRTHSRERTDYEGSGYNARHSGRHTARANQSNEVSCGMYSNDSLADGTYGVKGMLGEPDRQDKGASGVGSLFKNVWWGLRGCTLEVDYPSSTSDGPRVKRIKIGNGDGIGMEKSIIKGCLDRKGNVRVGCVFGNMR